ncbi:uncharacterized protein N7443_010461 [Penicillium atrosanguineum]|uniref:uncharacterized protein n=1 Tax=Penicillium atrosanguineum TaxID=1132637 RepID=UPI0023835BD3|nr:uncharacterized protein N7443_010461 [Penicillium atrosanguineum]KAJ5290208.1 hypothetical protein N7443_010461 [Penicillium atrosanguineum]
MVKWKRRFCSRHPRPTIGANHTGQILAPALKIGLSHLQNRATGSGRVWSKNQQFSLDAIEYMSIETLPLFALFRVDFVSTILKVYCIHSYNEPIPIIPSTFAVEPGSPIPLDEIKDSTKTEAVLLQIIEDTQSFPPPPSRSPLARNKSSAVTEASPAHISPRSPRNWSRPPKSNRALPSQSPSNTSSSGRTVSSAVSPQSSQSSASPVPIRSIFPQFNPKLPLNKQHFNPPMHAETPAAKPRRPQLTLSTPSSDIDQALGPKTVPASILNFPAGVLEPEEIRYSSPQELELLWEAANGQRAQNLFGTFNMRMTRTGPATFTFGSSQHPFYTLETYSNDDLSISRGVPSKPNSDVPIMTLSLEERRRREHPNDGLVALLFSRLAAMLAIEQADEVSKEHNLAGSEAAEVESNALKRAAAQESCRLSWNRNLRLYELRHPSLSKREPPALVGAAGIPLSPVRTQSPGILHITVSEPSSDASPHQPPTIIVTGPVSFTAMAAAQQAATARTSTMPVSDADEPLAALDFATRTLSISPAAVIATIPSLYAIDSLVAAMLAVAVSDEATNPILADMSLGSPLLEPAVISHSSNSISYNGPLIMTLAEREDYAQSMHLADQIESAKAQADFAPKRKSILKFWERAPSTSQTHSKSKSKKKEEIVVEEFDLEKYGRYGHSSSRKGEKLPGITRSLLKVLFFGLDLFVKTLTLLVKILAWLLVNSTRCVTSEKF